MSKLTNNDGLLSITSSVEEAVDPIQEMLVEERARLMAEAGLEEKKSNHFKKPQENPFTKDQRSHTTLLFGGLTWKHEHLLHGAFEGLGYKCE
ncbi:uncharacterized protein METZ01_LOCUS339715, partial [marine metagenome]